MVERYNTYYGSIAYRSTGREICADGEHVSATDYDVYEARIAELERERNKYRESSAKAYVEAEDLRAELARVKAESLRVVRNPTGGQKRRPEFVAYISFEGGHVHLERWEMEE